MSKKKKKQIMRLIDGTILGFDDKQYNITTAIKAEAKNLLRTVLTDRSLKKLLMVLGTVFNTESDLSVDVIGIDQLWTPFCRVSCFNPVTNASYVMIRASQDLLDDLCIYHIYRDLVLENRSRPVVKKDVFIKRLDELCPVSGGSNE